MQAATRLGELLKQPVTYTKDSIGPEVNASSSDVCCGISMVPHHSSPQVSAAVSALKPGTVLLLENVRFYAGEEANDADYCKKVTVTTALWLALLTSLLCAFQLVEAIQPEVYVNDAFGAYLARCHVL